MASARKLAFRPTFASGVPFVALAVVGGLVFVQSCVVDPTDDELPGALAIDVTAQWWDETLPASQVTIQLVGPDTPRTLITDDDGRATVDELAPGSYTITPTSTERFVFGADASVSATVSSGLSATATITGQSATGLVRGIIYVDRDGSGAGDPGEELSAVDISLASSGGTVRATESTGLDGTYVFATVPVGTYDLDFVLPTGVFVDVTVDRSVEVGADATLIRDFTSRVGGQATVDPTERDSVVGPEGIALVTPAGAVSASGVVTITQYDAPLPSGPPLDPRGTAVEIVLDGATLVGDVRLEFPVDLTSPEFSATAPEDLQLAFLDGGQLVAVASQFDAVRSVLAATVDHLSVWTVVRPVDEDNTLPVAIIDEPADGATFAAGDDISYSGRGQDAEDGDLAAEQLTWWADLHHDTHTHPLLPRTTGASGSVTIPTVGETSDNIWYRFYLEAVDSQGATHTVFREIQPVKSTMTFETEPAGLEILLDGQPQTAPFSVLGVVGIEREIGVASPQTSDGTEYEFSSWSDGGAQTHQISTPAGDATFRAVFTPVGTGNEPPTVAITSPAAGTNVMVNTTVSVTATAEDSDGTVTGVEFFANGASIGSATGSPYTVSWTPTQVEAVQLTARATDDDNATADADPVDVVVITDGGSDNTPPSVTITAPGDGSTNLFDPLTITADATDNVGVEGVQFQLDGEDLGPEDTAAPFEVPLPDTDLYTSGIHVIRARARDAAGNLSEWAVSTVTFGGNVNLPQGFSRTDFVDGLPLTTTMAFAPDGRLFIALQNGDLRVVENGTLLSEPFVTLPVATGGEYGLLGVTFHPNFASNGYVYVYYTTEDGGAHNRVSRFTATGNVAESGSEVVIADLPTLNTSRAHLGGALHFGLDDALYIATGDNRTPTNADDLTSVFGKVLRLNDDGSIPNDNPFLDITSGLSQAIWALGLRNPFTFGFQPGTGRMFINDVGEDAWEEINEGVAGADYGWPTTEGPTTDPRFMGPLYAYPQSGALLTGASIVGAAFYNPAVTSFPSTYEGDYFFADFVDGWVSRLDLDNDNHVYAFAQLPGFITDVRVGPDGALYILGQINSTWGVHRIGANP